MSLLDPCLIRTGGPFGEPVVRLGMPLVDDYLDFLAGRCRPNTVLAAAYDLRVFFRVVGKPADAVRPADVRAFITAQRTGPRRRAAGATGGRDGGTGRPGDQHGGPAVVDRLRVLRVSAGPWGRAGEPGAPWAADPPGAVPPGPGRAADPTDPPAAADPDPRRRSTR
jgi:hypothetical protein